MLRIGQRRIEFLHGSLSGSQSRCDLRSPVAVIRSNVAQDSSCIVQDGNDFCLIVIWDAFEKLTESDKVIDDFICLRCVVWPEQRCQDTTALLRLDLGACRKRISFRSQRYEIERCGRSQECQDSQDFRILKNLDIFIHDDVCVDRFQFLLFSNDGHDIHHSSTGEATDLHRRTFAESVDSIFNIEDHDIGRYFFKQIQFGQRDANECEERNSAQQEKTRFDYRPIHRSSEYLYPPVAVGKKINFRRVLRWWEIASERREVVRFARAAAWKSGVGAEP